MLRSRRNSISGNGTASRSGRSSSTCSITRNTRAAIFPTLRHSTRLASIAAYLSRIARVSVRSTGSSRATHGNWTLLRGLLFSPQNDQRVLDTNKTGLWTLLLDEKIRPIPCGIANLGQQPGLKPKRTHHGQQAALYRDRCWRPQRAYYWYHKLGRRARRTACPAKCLERARRGRSWIRKRAKVHPALRWSGH